MATPREFLLRVVPWPGEGATGYINLHWLKPGRKGFSGRPYKNVDELLSMADWLAVHPSAAAHIYFCLSRQKRTGTLKNGTIIAARSQNWTDALKAVWFDIDVKPEKGYATQSEALDALKKFVSDTGVPTPTAIVSSGSGGLHVYWISDRELSKEQWYPYALGLDMLARKHNLRIDPGLTTDDARVLRVPGTPNYKHTPPTACTLLGLAKTDYDFEQALGKFRTYERPVTATVNAVTKAATEYFDPAAFPPRPVPPGETYDNSLEAGIGYSDAPLDWKPIVAACPHFAEAWKTHGAGYEQGLWMLDVLSATFMEDALPVAHVLSLGHKGYSRDETTAMFERKTKERAALGLGWPSCKSFADAGCKSCATCPFAGKVRSPLNLGSPPQRPDPTPPPTTDDLYLPDGYDTNDEGHIIEVVERIDKDGNLLEPQHFQLFWSILRNPDARAGKAGERTLNFYCSRDLDNEEYVQIPEIAILGPENDLMRALAKAGVKVYRRNQNRLAQFMVAWLAKLDRIHKRRQLVPFGWVKENGERIGFAYGGKVFRSDGTSINAGAGDPGFDPMYLPRGQAAPWYEALNMIIAQHRPALECAVAMSFGSVLMHLPGQYAGVVSFWSAGSGGHKSTSIRTGAAVWGTPKKTIENTSVSNLALMRKLGYLSNLPVYWDELNDEQRLATVVPLIGQFTQGSEGGKMFSDRTFREKAEWQSLVGVGLNSSLWSEVTKRKKTTDANIYRIFEIEVQKVEGVLSPIDVETLILSLDDNFGWAGLKYAEWLGTHIEYVQTEGKKILKDFEATFKPVNAERFWMAVAGVIFLGAMFANEALGVKFNLVELGEFLSKTFFELRKRAVTTGMVAGAVQTTEDLLNLFLKAKGENTIWCEQPPMRGRSSSAFVRVIAGFDVRFPRQTHVRWNTGPQLLMLSENEFIKFALDQGYNTEQALKGLQQHYGANVDAGRKNLGVGTGLGAAERVIEIQVLPDTDLYDNMVSRLDKADRKPVLKVVGNDKIDATLAKAAGEAQELIQQGLQGGSPESAPTFEILPSQNQGQT